jgi:acyl transferase domain-containing protein/acyl carrier protein
MLTDFDLEIATVNSVKDCVVAGEIEKVVQFQTILEEKEIACRRLQTSHAFHSKMMAPILRPFIAKVAQVQCNAPTIPFVSNVTGTWITKEEATNPEYYAKHLRSCVRFADGVTNFFDQTDQILLEVGPGHTLSTLAKRHPHKSDAQIILTSLRHPREKVSDSAFIRKSLGRLWLSGIEVDWKRYYGEEKYYRVPLPTYPFERKRHWINPPKQHTFGHVDLQHLWQASVDAGRKQSQVGLAEFETPKFKEQLALQEQLCVAFMAKALVDLGAYANPDDKLSVTELVTQFSIKPDYKQLLSRWLELLVQRDMLQQEADLFFCLKPLPSQAFDALVQEFQAKFAPDQPEQARLVQSFGETHVPLLTGKELPQNILFADGNLDVYAMLERESVLSPYNNAIMGAIVEKIVELLPQTTHLNILEIGAGQGWTTGWLLPVLPADRTRYTYTDVGKSFLTFGKKKFQQYPFVEYRLFDMNNSPQEQGFTPSSYDLVIASQVLHVTDNLTMALRHVRSLLSPGGLTVIWEATRPSIQFDTIFGLLMPAFDDPSFEEGVRNSGKPFISKAKWQKMLQSHGFAQVAHFPHKEPSWTHIFLAKADSPTNQSISAAFSRQIEAVSSSKEFSTLKPDLADWFYVPAWQHAPLGPLLSKENSANTPILLFMDKCGLSTALAKHLEEAAVTVICVHAGENFARSDFYSYTLNPVDANDYQMLVQALKERKQTPKTIVHSWNVTKAQAADITLASIDKANQRGFYSLLYLTQALGEQNIDDKMEMIVLSNRLQDVSGKELTEPEKASLIGPVRVIPQEYSHIHCRSVDVVLPPPESPAEERLMTQLLNEIQQPSEARIIAYRGDRRWVETFSPVPLAFEQKRPSQLKEKGVYLITGGLGGLGLILAEHLANRVQAKLILIGRSQFPERKMWVKWQADHFEEDPTSRKIQKIKAIEALGSQVLVVQADVAKQTEMTDAITRAQRQVGKIDGVFHLAGTLADASIGNKTEAMAKKVFRPKITGTLVLDTLFANAQLDFMVLFSSTASIAPGFGQVDHSAACNFEDAFARYKSFSGPRLTISINQPAWKETGAAVAAARKYKILKVKKLNHPLYNKYILEKGRKIYVGTLSPHTHWILGEHLLLDKPTVVGTAYLEIARDAYECHSGQAVMEIRNIYFITPLTLEENEARQFRTILTLKESGVEFSIQSMISPPHNWQEHAKGEIIPLDLTDQVVYNLTDLRTECLDKASLPTLDKDFVSFGPRWWNNVTSRRIGEDRALARVELPDQFSQDLAIHKLHPALMDVIVGFTGGLRDRAYIPYSYESVKIRGPLPEKLYAYSTKFQKKLDTYSVSQISVMDAEGAELVAIENILSLAFDSQPSDGKSDIQKPESIPPSATSKGRSSDLFNPLLAKLTHGVSNKEGMDCLDRILRSNIPHIIISPVEFSKQAEPLTPLLSTTALQVTGNDDKAAVIPNDQTKEIHDNQIEASITQVWREILGVENIRPNDNFFELGGDSLLVIQVRSKLTKVLGQKISPTNLFVYPTIRSLAEYIIEQRKPTSTPEDSEEATQQKETPLMNIEDKNRSLRQRRQQVLDLDL